MSTSRQCNTADGDQCIWLQCLHPAVHFFVVREGKIVDESRDPALRSVFAANMGRPAPMCLSNKRYRNGACAAYLADAVRAGQFEAAGAL